MAAVDISLRAHARVHAGQIIRRGAAGVIEHGGSFFFVDHADVEAKRSFLRCRFKHFGNLLLIIGKA